MAVKEFQIVLSSPPLRRWRQRQWHVVMPNCDVSGHVLLALDEPQSGFKAIKVSLEGRATARWEQPTGQYAKNVTPTKTIIIDNTAVLWSQEDSPGGQIEAGSHQFPFSLIFQSNGPLPPTYHSRLGNIVYEVEAVIMKTSSEMNRKIAVELLLPIIISVDDPNATVIPRVLEPKTLQVQKTLCCASGSISLTARIPRSGYCIRVGDAIPLEVDVENGSSRQIRYLQAVLIRRVIYSAQRERLIDPTNLGCVNSGPVQPGDSFLWRPPPIPVPNTEACIINCSIITSDYVLKVRAITSGIIINPHVEFNLFFWQRTGSEWFEDSLPLPTGTLATVPTASSVPSQ